MTPDPGTLLEGALKLAPEARAALAASLLENLDEVVDEDAEDAWAAEIAKRINDAGFRSGHADSVVRGTPPDS